MSTEHISADDALHVLWHYGHPDGQQPGSFTEHIVIAAHKADPGNRERLRAGFPGIVEAVEVGIQHPRGIDELRKIARRI